MKKILEISETTITSYPHHAHIYSILSTNRLMLPAVLNHYMQLTCNKTINRVDFNIGINIEQYTRNYPLLKYGCVDRNIIKTKYIHLVDFIIEYINAGFYIRLLIDEFYISCYKSNYHRKHFFHEILIYGYDDDEKKVFVADFFDMGKYVFNEAEFEEINEGFKFDLDDWLYGVQIYKKIPLYYNVYFDVKKLKNDIMHFITASEIYGITAPEIGIRHKEDFIYGSDIYDYLDTYVTENSHMDIRMFYAIIAHINYMEILVEELYWYRKISNNVIIRQYLSDLKEMANKILSLILKKNYMYDLGINNEELNPNISNNLKILKDNHIKFLETLYKNMSVYSDYYLPWKYDITPFSHTITKNKKEKAFSFLFLGKQIWINLTKSDINKVKIDSINFENFELHNNGVLFNNLTSGYHIMEIDCDISINKFECVFDKNDDVINFCGDYTIKEYDIPSLEKFEGYDYFDGRLKLPEYMTEESVCYCDVEYVNSALYEKDIMNTYTINKYVESSCLVSKDKFDIHIIVPNNIRKKIFFDFIDLEKIEHKVCIEIWDGDKNKIINEIFIERNDADYSVSLEVSGHILFRFINKGGNNVTLAGWRIK